MLDPKLLRKKSGWVAEQLQHRGYELDLAQFETLESERRQADASLQELQTERRRIARQVGELRRQDVPLEEAKQQVRERLERVDAEMDTLKQRREQAHEALQEFLALVPNLPHADAPQGLSAAQNVECSRWGELPEFSFAVRDHVDLCGAQHLDFEAASRLAGARFNVLYDEIAQLHRALGQCMLDLHVEQHGYREAYVPYIAAGETLWGVGQLPKFAEDIFRLDEERDFYLIPTAEVPLSNLFRERIFTAEEVGEPLRLVAHTPCFRREAGSSGRDTRGIMRQHQFDKVELVHLSRPGQAVENLERMTADAEAVLRLLELPYRKVELCAGELGFSACRTYDLEVWMPAQEQYREISSCSHCGDFQARRMMARWRNPETGTIEYLHTLNGSGVAVGRCMAALLENRQNADGSVGLPPPLWPYMKGKKHILARD